MTIATDALIKGNQLIHEYVNSGKQGFRTCLDQNKAIMQLSEQYPGCMEEE